MNKLIGRLSLYAIVTAGFLYTGIKYGFGEVKWMGLAFLIIFILAEVGTYISIKRRTK